MMHNNLFFNRLIIITDEGKTAYDEIFHKGVNIIRGENSSGKSTITHFIFYVLGASFNDFVPEARKCSVVFAEVEMNGAIFSIKRHIEKDDEENINPKAPLYIYWGTLEESRNVTQDKGWQKFGYNTIDSKKSFSNVLFENLGLPIVKGDNNITFHQILRLLYIDQESPTSSLFYYEHFDSQITRETVSDLLLGVYNEELYENKKRLVVADKELDSTKSELRATKQFFTDPLTLSPTHLKTTIENKAAEILKIEAEIVAIRNKEKEIEYKKNAKLNFQQLNEEAITQRKIVLAVEEKISEVNAEIEDSEYFVETLKTKITAVRNSIQTREFLGNLPLEYCPECLTKIKPHDHSKNCKLCKESTDESFGVVQARRMEQEIGFQIKESEHLLEISKREVIELKSQHKNELVKLNQIQRQVNSALNDVKSYNEETVDQLNVDKGNIEGEILQYRTMLEHAELYDTLLKRKNTLDNEVNYLKNYIFQTERKQVQLKEQINEQIKEEGIYLLNNDLNRQDDFKNASEFFIDYSNNMAFLSSKFSKYSASSNFYLKVTARFAIFLASLSIDRMRYPRFIFADNMEDKGIEVLRAQNLQKLLIDRTAQFSSDTYQMIYTTSYITDELNKSSYVVGEFYTKTNRSLKHIVM
ncbi:MAG: AAA family ATPase [Bacteroidota bacterium]